uniref:Zinc finger GRF-type domain-containing protein n=1 Tax=Lactuca sativa TaxID=4236 RepID=A0A9R1X2N8_LACSA|nr:hypothetical protein LSAT_V11C700369550 [Lactuca sativa]
MVLCFYGKMAIVRTAWTDKNPGRRFWGSPTEGSKCRFIGWFDGPICERSKAIISGLLRSINKLKSQNTRLKCYLLCSWVLFVFVLVYKK